MTISAIEVARPTCAGMSDGLASKSGEPSPMKDSGGGDEQEQTKTIYERVQTGGGAADADQRTQRRASFGIAKSTLSRWRSEHEQSDLLEGPQPYGVADGNLITRAEQRKQKEGTTHDDENEDTQSTGQIYSPLQLPSIAIRP